jgi:hypothetical protein
MKTFDIEALRAAPALSIRQPWAELIVAGRKTIELRTWVPPFRGLIWIHAGNKVDAPLEDRFGCHDLVHGGIVGLTELQAVVPMDRERWELWRAKHLDLSPFIEGMYAWVVANSIRLSHPLTVPGKLKFFALTDELVKRLVEANSDLSAGSAEEGSRQDSTSTLPH